jgi:hypothetical protein
MKSRLIAATALLLTSAPPASACVVPVSPLTEQQIRDVRAPNKAIIGKVEHSYWREGNRQAGDAIVLVRVEESFGVNAPAPGSVIFIHSPGAGWCSNISSEKGSTVMAVIIGGMGKPYLPMQVGYRP